MKNAHSCYRSSTIINLYYPKCFQCLDIDFFKLNFITEFLYESGKHIIFRNSQKECMLIG